MDGATHAAQTPPPVPGAERGRTRMHVEHVLRADKGVDLDFRRGRSGSPVARGSR